MTYNIIVLPCPACKAYLETTVYGDTSELDTTSFDPDASDFKGKYLLHQAPTRDVFALYGNVYTCVQCGANFEVDANVQAYTSYKDPEPEAEKKPEQIDLDTFLHGLMLALRGRTTEMESSSDIYYTAFMAVIDFARTDPPVCVEGIKGVRRDPMFNKALDGERMLTNAELDRLVVLGRNPFDIFFRITMMQARKELADIGHTGWFHQCARVFSDPMRLEKVALAKKGKT